MKVGRLAIMKEGKRGRRSADSSEEERQVAVSVAVHLRLSAVKMWSSQGAVRG